jgi:hypothetical protein
MDDFATYEPAIRKAVTAEIIALDLGSGSASDRATEHFVNSALNAVQLIYQPAHDDALFQAKMERMFNCTPPYREDWHDSEAAVYARAHARNNLQAETLRCRTFSQRNGDEITVDSNRLVDNYCAHLADVAYHALLNAKGIERPSVAVHTRA